MRDYEEKSFYEIQLDNKQLVLVFLAALTVCVLIFVLGVMIGKGQKEAEIAAASKQESAVQMPVADEPAPQQVVTDLPVQQSKPVETKKVTTQPVADRYSLDDLDTKYEDSQKASAPLKTVNSAEAAEPDADDPEGMQESAKAKQFTVQVIATSSKTKAQEQLSVLKSKGYKPFLDQEQTGAGLIFKVRVGKYEDSTSARQMVARLKKDFKLEPWVTMLD